jgi:hypothetical protein
MRALDLGFLACASLRVAVDSAVVEVDTRRCAGGIWETGGGIAGVAGGIARVAGDTFVIDVDSF